MDLLLGGVLPEAGVLTRRSNQGGETATVDERLFDVKRKSNGCLPRTRDRVTVDPMPDARPPPNPPDGPPGSPPASARCSSSSTPRPASRATRRACARSARRSACRRRPRSTRTSPPCRTRATCAATRASPGRSRSRSSRARAPPSTAGRCATFPLLGDVAAGTGVLAAENVEEVIPVPDRPQRRRRPLHAAGPRRVDDRRRHLRRRLRRRPFPADADNGDIVVAGIPGEEATVKTFLRKRNKIVLRPVERDDGRPRVRPGRRPDLRQARHPDAPDLNVRAHDHATPRNVSSNARHASRSARSTRLVGRVRELGIAGTEVARRDPVRGEAGDVGPTELGPHRQVVRPRSAPRSADA